MIPYLKQLKCKPDFGVGIIVYPGYILDSCGMYNHGIYFDIFKSLIWHTIMKALNLRSDNCNFPINPEYNKYVILTFHNVS